MRKLKWKNELSEVSVMRYSFACFNQAQTEIYSQCYIIICDRSLHHTVYEAVCELPVYRPSTGARLGKHSGYRISKYEIIYPVGLEEG